jgi:uncharacterized protein
VILVDANLLVYASDQASPDHARARTWLEAQLNAPHRVGLPWPTLLAFVRLVTNPVIVRYPITPAAAFAYAREWLARPNVWVPAPGDEHADIVERLLATAGMSSRLVPDAHLAALAIEHGLTLCSSDGDFARFPGLAWNNPLAVGDQGSGIRDQ